MSKYIWITIAVIAAILILGLKQASKEPEVARPEKPATETPIAEELAGEPIVSQSGNIKVTEPQPQIKVASPLLVKGQARVFENTIQLRLKDAAGNVITEKSGAYESANAGEFGSFGELLLFDKTNASEGTLEVYSISAKDGSEIDKVEVPVRF